MVSYDYAYDKEVYENEEAGINHKSEGELSFKVYDGAVVLPWNERGQGGVVDSNHKFISGTGVTRGHDGYYNCEEYIEDKRSVIYLGCMFGCWGHSITDEIKRIWFLLSDTYKNDYMDYTVIYTYAFERDVHPNFVQMLEVLGIKVEYFEKITRPTKFNKIVVPDESFFEDGNGTRLYTKEYKAVIDRIRNAKLPCENLENYKKIYYSYSKFRTNRSYGEKSLERFFEEKGYKVIYPENYTFIQQLSMLQNCDEFASTIGSCSHNIVFLRDNTKVTLIPRTFYLTGYQTALNTLHNLDIKIVDSSLSIFCKREEPWDGPFCFCVSDELLKCYNKEKTSDYIKDNWKNFIEYKRECRKLTDFEKRISPEWYLNKTIKYISDYRNVCCRNRIIFRQFVGKVRLSHIRAYILLKLKKGDSF